MPSGRRTSGASKARRSSPLKPTSPRPSPLISQTTVCVTCGSATPASQRRTAPSRWTCSATRCRPGASTPATSTTTARPASATTARDSTAACARYGRATLLVVWKFDRLGRNLALLVNTVQDLSARGVGLRVLTGQGAQILSPVLDSYFLRVGQYAGQPAYKTRPRKRRTRRWR